MITFPFPMQTQEFHYTDQPPVELKISLDLQKIVDSLSKCDVDEFQLIRYQLEGIRQYVIALKGFTIYDEPQRSGSWNARPPSRAFYLAHYEEPGHAFKLQYLPPHSFTSRHFHDAPVEEIHHGLLGQAVLNIRGKDDSPKHARDIHLHSEESHRLSPGIIHQLRTGSQSSLVLVEIIGNQSSLDDLVHNYVED